MATATLYKNPEFTGDVETEGGAPFPDGGFAVELPLSDYYADLVNRATLLTFERPNGNSTTPLTGTVGAVTASTVITVDIGLGVETAYINLAFTEQYAAGSTINLTTGAYSLVRAGGFPSGSSAVTINPPSGALPFKVLYEVDLTAQSSQAISAPGVYTIDGKSWYAKGALTGQPNGNSQTSAVVLGSGLGIANDPAANSNSLYYGAVVYPYRHFFFPFAQLTGYDAAAPLLVRFHSTDVGGSNGTCAVVGISSSTNDGVALSGAHRQYDSWLDLYNNSTDHTNPAKKRGNGTGSTLPDDYQGSANFVAGAVSQREFGIYRLFGDVSVEVAGAVGGWAGSFGALTSLVTYGTPLRPFLSGTRSNPGAFFAIRGQLNGGMAYLTHMQIMQPRL